MSVLLDVYTVMLFLGVWGFMWCVSAFGYAICVAVLRCVIGVWASCGVSVLSDVHTALLF